jgi:hypothetical protein
MAEAERTKERNELKIKRWEYTGYDDDEFVEGREGMKRRILSKYDEFLEGPKETLSNLESFLSFIHFELKGFRLGASDLSNALGPLDSITFPETEPACAGIQTVRVCVLLNAGWPTPFVSPSFLLTTNLSDPIFGDVLGALQILARDRGAGPTVIQLSQVTHVLQYPSNPLHRRPARSYPLPRESGRVSRSRILLMHLHRCWRGLSRMCRGTRDVIHSQF